MPDGIDEPFLRAEEVVAAYFRERREDPSHGSLEISGERYVLVRAASLSVEFFALVRDLYGPGREAEADAFSRNLLFDLAHAVGRSDARLFHRKMGLDDPMAKLSAGPVHFAHAGWASVHILPGSRPSPDESYEIVYDHPYAFESDAWLRAGRPADFPVCIMNAAYSSGWCEQSFGVELLATEILCRARGDEACRFVMAPPSRLEAAVERYVAEADLGTRARGYEIPGFFARKRMEEELRRARAELEQRVEARTRELLEANERLRREMEERGRIEDQLRQTQKLEAVGRLAAGVAHDFNNILSVVLNRGVLVASRLDEADPLRAELDEIVQAARRAAGLTRNLLAFSRAQVIARERLELDPLVRDIARLMGRILGEHVELELRHGAPGAAVEADRGQMEQVLTNLLVNARDAMPSGGRLTVATDVEDVAPGAAGELAPGRYVTVTVRDTGVGMDAATVERVFEPFFTTKEKGSGLGLATVYGIVAQSSGRITVRSAPGEGSAFTLWFPRADAAPKPSPPPPRAARDPLRGDEHILLVEDQDAVRSSLRAILTRFGYTVHEARDALGALTIADQVPELALVLTDVVMPRMGGRALAERLAVTRPDLAVVFMSGYAADFTEEDYARGAAYLQKPFAPDELLRTLREVLARAKPSAT